MNQGLNIKHNNDKNYNKLDESSIGSKTSMNKS